MQVNKLTSRLEEANLAKADAEKRFARLEAELKDVELEAQDTVGVWYCIL